MAMANKVVLLIEIAIFVHVVAYRYIINKNNMNNSVFQFRMAAIVLKYIRKGASLYMLLQLLLVKLLIFQKNRKNDCLFKFLNEKKNRH